MLFFEDEPQVHAEQTAKAEHTNVGFCQPGHNTSELEAGNQYAQDELDHNTCPAIDHRASGITPLAYSNDGRLTANDSCV